MKRYPTSGADGKNARRVKLPAPVPLSSRESGFLFRGSRVRPLDSLLSPKIPIMSFVVLNVNINAHENWIEKYMGMLQDCVLLSYHVEPLLKMTFDTMF